MTQFGKERQGELFIVTEAILWSLFPVVTVLSYISVSPIVSLAWSTLFAALFFVCVVLLKHSWHELKKFMHIRIFFLVRSSRASVTIFFSFLDFSTQARVMPR